MLKHVPGDRHVCEPERLVGIQDGYTHLVERVSQGGGRRRLIGPQRLLFVAVERERDLGR